MCKKNLLIVNCLIKIIFLNCFIVVIKGDLVNNLIINAKEKSWITDDDFEIFLKYSFPLSRCCNIYIDEDDEGIDAIFDQFIRIYPFEYYLRHREYECQAYFLLSSSPLRIKKAMIKVPVTISTTEILIIINDYMNESSTLLNPNLFAYSNLNVVSKLEVWTLSENYLYPRAFKKVENLTDMIHDYGIVDLQGRELQISAIHMPPLTYLSTTINKTVNGINGEFYALKDELEHDGVEMKLFLIIAERLNFTWTIRKPTDGWRYGRPNGTNWNGGMIGQVWRKEVDVAFSGIWLKHDFNKYVNLSQPWYQLSIHFLVPRPKPVQNFWALTRPLAPSLWAAITAMVTIQSLNLYIKAWINPQVPSRFKNFLTTLMELIGRLVGFWAPSKTVGLRVQLHLWHVAGVLLVTAYSSSLAARLTTPDYEKRIDTIRQFIEKNLTWGKTGSVPSFDDYFDLRDPYAGKFPSLFQHENSSEERHQKILEGHYAIVGTIVQGIFFPENDIDPDDFAMYRVMKEPTGHYFVSFAVQPWLLRSFDSVISWIRETGLAMYHLNNVIHRRTSLSLREVLIEHDVETSEAKALIITPLGAGFTMLLFGNFIAFIIFCFEIKAIQKLKNFIKIKFHNKLTSSILPN